MGWVQLLPLILLSTLILILPGAGLAAAFGVRGTLLVVVGPPLTMGLTAGAGIVLERVHISWSLWTFGATSLAVIAIAYAIWHAVRIISGVELRARCGIDVRTLLIGLGIAAVVMTAVLVVVFPDPDLFAQTFDNVFHTNVIQFILDTGSASSLTVSQVASGPGPNVGYPAAWHGFVSLALGTVRIVQPAVTVAAAINAATLTVGVFAWGLGVFALTQVVAGPSIPTTTMAAALTTTIPLFPWFYLEWGSLYPNLLANSLVPGLLAVLLLLRAPPTNPSPPSRATTPTATSTGEPVDDGAAPITQGRRFVLDGPARQPLSPRGVQLQGGHSRVVLVLVAAASLPGLALAHPNALFTLGVGALVIGWAGYANSFTRSARRRVGRLLLTGVTLTGLTVAGCYAWVALAPESPVDPPLPVDLWPAVWSSLLAAPAESSSTPALPALLVIGIVACAWRREFLYILLWLIPTAIYVVAVSSPPLVAFLFGGLFYQDPRRIAAFVLVLSLPLILASLGTLTSLFSWVAGALRPRVAGSIVLAVLTLGTSVGLSFLNYGLSLGPRIAETRAVLYDVSEKSRYVSADERALMGRMREVLPPDAKVIGDPGNGTPFIYSVTGIRVVFGHVFSNDSPAMSQVRKYLFDENQLDATCQALRDLNAFYFADFGRGSQYFAGFRYFPGLAPTNYSFLKLLDSQGDARLYRITACD